MADDPPADDKTPPAEPESPPPASETSPETEEAEGCLIDSDPCGEWAAPETAPMPNYYGVEPPETIEASLESDETTVLAMAEAEAGEAEDISPRPTGTGHGVA